MKLSLVVETGGKSKGKVIPVTLSKFIIGRNPDCHLRPASMQISKRHCALVVRGSRVFIRDFNSTNGTLVNNRLIKGEIELENLDRLKIGPLEFSVRLATSTPVNAATPPPPTRSPGRPADEDAVAALLLSLDGDAGPNPPVDAQGVPEGSTEIKLPAFDTAGNGQLQTRSDGAAAIPAQPKAPAAKPATADTSAAAKSILDKYLRRSR